MAVNRLVSKTPRHQRSVTLRQCLAEGSQPSPKADSSVTHAGDVLHTRAAVCLPQKPTRAGGLQGRGNCALTNTGTVTGGHDIGGRCDGNLDLPRLSTTTVLDTQCTDTSSHAPLAEPAAAVLAGTTIAQCAER